jgi:hypothetical protein
MGDGPHESENPPRTLLGNALLGTTDPNVLRRAEEGRIETRHYAAVGRVAANWAYLALVRNQPLDLTGWWGGSYSSIRREIRRIRY